MDDILINYLIEQEKEGKQYLISDSDRNKLDAMLREINQICNTDFHYLVQLDIYMIPNAGKVVKKYINTFDSQFARSCILHFLVEDHTEDCEYLILKLYLDFKESSSYISEENMPAPAGTTVRYDNAFRKLKPKRIKKELEELLANPRDAYYLPFTTRMVASWRGEQFVQVLLFYLNGDGITAETVGLSKQGVFYPSLNTIKRQLRFIALGSLKYYPSIENKKLLESYQKSNDQDIKMAAEKTLRAFANRSL